MRIASLVPSATEALFALGLGDSVVAVTHECDHPPAAARLPKLTASVIAEGLDAGRDRRQGARGHRPRRVALHPRRADPGRARPGPDRHPGAVRGVRRLLRRRPRGRRPPRRAGRRCSRSTPRRSTRCSPTSCGSPPRPASPRAATGCWRTCEERLAAVDARRRRPPAPARRGARVARPGLRRGPLGPGDDRARRRRGRPRAPRARSRGWSPGRRSPPPRPRSSWSMPCGLYVDEAAAQARGRGERLRELGAGRVVAVDAASSFSRPGPRLVDGVELLAHVLHPEPSRRRAGIGYEVVAELSPRALSRALSRAREGGSSRRRAAPPTTATAQSATRPAASSIPALLRPAALERVDQQRRESPLRSALRGDRRC